MANILDVPTFDPGTLIATGATSNHEIYRLAIGDLNNDGRPDIALAHGYRTVGLIFNQGGEAMSAETVLSEPWWDVDANIGASSITIADLDLDGAQDLVVTLYGPHYAGQNVQLYQGNGDGSFDLWPVGGDGIVHTGPGTNPMFSVVADFNRDGRPDLAVSHNNGGWPVDVLRQNADGSFVVTDSDQAGQNPQFMATADFNEDGYMDVVSGAYWTGIYVFINQANESGSLAKAGPTYVGPRHQFVVVGDFDNDGHQDFAARGNGDNLVHVRYGDGDGLFSRTSAFAVTGIDGMLAAGDLDGDGLTDLAVASRSTNSVDLLINDAGGGFEAVQSIALGTAPNSVALADFNGDGSLDIAVGRDDFSVQILWNRSAAETIVGTSGDDDLAGTDGNDQILGLGGNDTLSGARGDDTLAGGAGNDTLDGGAGTDSADFSDRARPVVLILRGADDGTATRGAEQDTLRSIERVTAGSGDDLLRGDGKANDLRGGAGDDTISGGAGPDVLDGGEGYDILDLSDRNADVLVALYTRGDAIVYVGGPAEDRVRGFEGVVGGAGDDHFSGDDGDNVLVGGAGNDSLFGGGWGQFGDDTLSGGEGHDYLEGGSGSDVMDGGTGNDTLQAWGQGEVIRGGTGLDTVSYYGSDIGEVRLAGSNVDTLDSIENVIGSAITGCVIIGNDEANVLEAVWIANTLRGGGGDDTLLSRELTYDGTRFYGGAGNDTITGRGAFYGGAGADAMLSGLDRNVTEDHYSQARYDDEDWGDLVISLADPSLNTGAAAGDTYVNINNVVGGRGNDRIAGNGLSNILTGGAGNDTLAGGNGIDTADFSDRAKSVVAELNGAAEGTATLGTEQDTLRSIENVTGGAGADILRGDDAVNILRGGDGNDTLRGGAGIDTLIGDNGSDTADYSDQTLSVTVEPDMAMAYVAGVRADDLESIENLIGGSAGDRLSGSGAANSLAGGLGDDTLRGGAGDDTLLGGDGADRLGGAAGIDTLRGGGGNDTYINPGQDAIFEGVGGGIDTIQSNATLSLQGFDNIERLDLTGSGSIDGLGSDRHDVISGNAGANVLSGGSGDDKLNGASGHDTLVGGEGNDTLKGGSGADVFRFSTSGDGTDTIKEFETGLDRFDLSGGLFTGTNTVGPNTVLLHAGGTIIVERVTGLSLEDWNELVILPSDASGTWPGYAAPGEGFDALDLARAESSFVRSGHGDWAYA